MRFPNITQANFLVIFSFLLLVLENPSIFICLIISIIKLLHYYLVYPIHLTYSILLFMPISFLFIIFITLILF